MCKGTLIVELCNCRVRHAASYFNWYDGYTQHVSSIVIARTHFKLYIIIWTGPIIPIHIILALREKNRSTRTRVNSNILIADAIVVLKEDMK